MGLAVGVFFGLLIPIAQIPAAALVALLLRANIPAAVGSTLVTNPITFPPVYYAAYHLGDWLLGSEKNSAPVELDQIAHRPRPASPSGWSAFRLWARRWR